MTHIVHLRFTSLGQQKLKINTLKNLRKINITNCVDPFARPFNRHHHLVKVCEKMLDNEMEVAFEILENYHASFIPKSCEEALGLNTGAHKFDVFEYPWGTFQVKQRGPKDITKSRFCGPTSGDMLQKEFDDFFALVTSIRDQGYSPIRNRAVIGRVDLKVNGNKVPIIIQGNHRVACLMVLGYEKVLTTTLVGYKSLIDCSDRCHWPAVVSNKCESDYAMKICSKFIR